MRTSYLHLKLAAPLIALASMSLSTAAFASPAGSAPPTGSVTATLHGGACQFVVQGRFDPALYPNAEYYNVAIRQEGVGPPLGVYGPVSLSGSTGIVRFTVGFTSGHTMPQWERSSEAHIWYGDVALFDGSGNFVAGAATQHVERQCVYTGIAGVDG